MRQVVLDTETTGLSTAQGHRIIEIGCVELVNRRMTGREYHCFLNPERDIDEGAEQVHGISRKDLESQPLFAEVADEFLTFLRDSELVIHNAEFDVGFLEHELKLMEHPQPKITAHALVLDTLALARKMHPGQRNSLDALCKRYSVDASKRSVHGALIDAELLANVYLAMTGGQAALSLEEEAAQQISVFQETANEIRAEELDLLVVKADETELEAHNAFLKKMTDAGTCLWTDTDNFDKVQ